MDTQAVVHPRDGMYPASNPLLLHMTAPEAGQGGVLTLRFLL